jgi:hypothetical protein
MIVNQAFAREYWRNQNPIGQRLMSLDERLRTRLVVGAVGNVKHFAWMRPQTPKCRPSELLTSSPCFGGRRMGTRSGVLKVYGFLKAQLIDDRLRFADTPRIADAYQVELHNYIAIAWRGRGGLRRRLRRHLKNRRPRPPALPAAGGYVKNFQYGCAGA